jgi:anti-anti-sigma factor
MAHVGTTSLLMRTAGDPGAICVAVSGELDIAGSWALGQTLRELIARHRRVVLDLSGLEFMDSSGLQMVMEADLHARLVECRLEIVRGPRAVQRVFEICGVADELPFTR